MKKKDETPHSIREMDSRAQRNVRILELLRRKGPISRTDISKASGINPVTVSQYIDKLIELDLVYEKAYDVSSGGRRPLLLDITDGTAYTLGIGINLFGCHGVLTDLDGKIIEKVSHTCAVKEPGAILLQVVEVADALLSAKPEYQLRLKGLGVGLGGIIDEEKGVVRWPSSEGEPSYASVSMPLKGFLEDRYGCDVFLANDADMACFAEHWYSFDQNVRNIVYMYSGVSCGLLLGGELYRGKNWCAGELFVRSLDESHTGLGNVSFLHAWRHDLGLLSRTNGLLAQAGEARRCANIDDVFAENVDGVVAALDDAAHALGAKIAFLVNTLNPDAVVIGGGFERGGRLFIDAVSGYARKYAMEEMSRSLHIVPTGIGDLGVAMGAAAMMTKNVFANV